MREVGIGDIVISDANPEVLWVEPAKILVHVPLMLELEYINRSTAELPGNM